MTTLAAGRQTVAAVRLMSNETKDESYISASPTRHFSHSPTTNASSHYYIAAIILFGFVGNILCALASKSYPPLKRSRFSPYLIACSLSDTTFLLCLGLVWLKSIGVNWHDLGAVCTTSAFLSNASSFLSAWYVAAISLELSTTLGSPYRILVTFTSRRLLIKRVLVLAVISLLANTWTLAMTRAIQIQGYSRLALINDTYDDDSEPDEPITTPIVVCHFDTERETIFRAFTIYEIVLSVALPLAVTMTSVCVIFVRLVADRRAQDTTPDRKSSNTSHLRYESTIFQNFTAAAPVQVEQEQTPTSGGDENFQLQNRLEHFAVRLQTDSDRERRVLIVTTPTATIGGKLRPSVTSKRKTRHLMSPAKYHAMLHRKTLERCLQVENSIRPLLLLKSIIFLASSFPHFVFRLWGMLDDEDAQMNGHAIIIFLFYTQFALNAPLYAAYGSVRWFMNKKRK